MAQFKSNVESFVAGPVVSSLEGAAESLKASVERCFEKSASADITHIPVGNFTIVVVTCGYYEYTDEERAQMKSMTEFLVPSMRGYMGDPS